MSVEKYARRREKLRELLRKNKLDALLVSHAANRYYLSGFELHDCQCNESAGRLIITADGKDWLCTDSRYADAAKRLWDPSRIFIYGGDAAGQIHGLLRDSIGGVIGVEACCVNMRFYQRLAEGLRLEAADGLVEELRVIKDAEEIAALEKSFALNHALMRWIPQQCRAGRTEQELSWEIEKFFREGGASALAFENIVAVGRNGALPHAIPGADAVTENCPVLVDVGCRVDGYCSDQTRTFWAGPAPTPEFTRTLELVQRAQRAALDMMRPGVILCDVYRAARTVFECAGVEAFFTHGLGHGVGLETHEAPSLNSRAEAPLRKGMVVTVEPGLYYPQWGGVRWEYTVLVEDEGVRVL